MIGSKHRAYIAYTGDAVQLLLVCVDTDKQLYCDLIFYIRIRVLERLKQLTSVETLLIGLVHVPLKICPNPPIAM